MDSFVSPVCLPWNSKDPGHEVKTGDKTTITGKVILYKQSGDISMTQLLTHTVAHSTMPSFRPKTNNQPIKKFLSLALT